MNDDLRKYIQDRKEEWQDVPQPSGLWERIDSATKPKVVSIKKARWWVASTAAAMALIVSTALFFTKEASVSAHDPFDEVEQFYEAQLTSKLEQLRAFDVDQELLGEVDVLKSEYTDLKSEMEVSVNNEEILSQMMENYRWRLKIIGHLLMELEEDATETNPDSENVEI